MASTAHAQDVPARKTTKVDDDAASDKWSKPVMTFIVPLVSSSRAFGDVYLKINADKSIAIDAPNLRRELRKSLNDDGLNALDQVITRRLFITPEELRPAGFDIRFDSEQMRLEVVSIRPEFTKVQQLGGDAPQASRVEPVTIPPAQSSPPTNATGNHDHDTGPGDGFDATSDKSSKSIVTFNIPLVSSSRAFGDVYIKVGADNSIAIDAANLRRELSKTLNDEGLNALDQVVNGRPFITPDELRTAGFDIKFDSKQLQLEIVSIKPEFMKVQQLGGGTSNASRIELETIQPAHFSTYMNVTGNYDYDTRLGDGSPNVFFDGATRVGPVALEYEGAVTDQFSSSYRFYRRSTRAVYDDPKHYLRYSAGDLRLNSMSILRTPQIGGVGIEKGRQIFDPYYSVTQLGGRQIFLDNRSTVDVLVNGQQYDSFQLDAGTYDLSSLPIQQGSNDIKLVVRDSFGKQQIIDYNFTFEPLELPVGEEEYSLGFGFLSDSLGFQPSYGNELAASGYYRKALSQNLILGGAFQATQDTQVFGATTTVVPQFVPGVFDLELAGSRANNRTGFAFRSGYRFQSGNSLTNRSQFSVNVNYESSFTTIDNLIPIDFDLFSVSASYSKAFSQETYATVGASYLNTSRRRQDDYTVYVDVNHRVGTRLRFSVGAEYGQATAQRKSFGARLGLTVALGGQTRATADYRGRMRSMRATISRGSDNQIGSFGYDVSVSKFGDDTQADAQVNYVSNRFEARANLTSAGTSIGGVFDDQRARLQIGTSFAYADGAFGIGRPISNSFVLTQPHAALKDQGIITARSLSRGDYYARSGPLGAAVQGDLSPYAEQSIQYDAADPGEGFDVGDGVVQVKPPYKSGYKIVVGSAHFVSVIGHIADSDGPIALATGRVTAVDPEEDFKEQPYYTNAAGRFGMFGLAPGKSYKVTLTDSQRSFIIEIPAETGAIVRKGEIMLPAAK